MIRFGEILTVSHINYLSLLLNRSWLDEFVTEAYSLEFWFDLGNCALGILVKVTTTGRLDLQENIGIDLWLLLLL